MLMRLLLLAMAAVLPVSAQSTVRAWINGNQAAVLREFAELLSIPNVSSDLKNIRRNALHLERSLARRGVSARLLEHGSAAPVVFGQIDTPGAKRTIIFYAHYDGQPVDPKQWKSDPFRPVLREGERDLPLPGPGQVIDPEWRLYARSASDDKGAIMAMLAALDALRASRIPISANVRFFFEGEEEAGSENLSAIAQGHAALLKADAWMVCDGPVHQNRQQLIFFGARGEVGVDLTVYGATRELHSGHYGNWAPNPAMMLARLLASMKDDDGRILVRDFYAGAEPLSATERRALAEAPAMDDALRAELSLARTDGKGRTLLELINEPSLNVRGLASSAVGAQARNIVPASATASIDMRLVKGITPNMAVERLARHVRAQGYFVTSEEPDKDMRRTHPRIARIVRRRGYRAARTSMDLAISQAVIQAVESARGKSVKLPTLGGTVPLYIFNDELGTPGIGIPIANHDNNQHSFNENIRLGNLWDGVETMAALMSRL